MPTGLENVKARYRSGIGAAGNVDVGQLTNLLTRPLGVTGVTNPLPATGGADRDNRDQARERVPIALLALDRLVSVADFAGFARAFAGIRQGDGSGIERRSPPTRPCYDCRGRRRAHRHDLGPLSLVAWKPCSSLAIPSSRSS